MNIDWEMYWLISCFHWRCRNFITSSRTPKPTTSTSVFNDEPHEQSVQAHCTGRNSYLIPTASKWVLMEFVPNVNFSRHCFSVSQLQLVNLWSRGFSLKFIILNFCSSTQLPRNSDGFLWRHKKKFYVNFPLCLQKKTWFFIVENYVIIRIEKTMFTLKKILYETSLLYNVYQNVYILNLFII